MNFNFGHFWVIFGQNTKVIALPFGQKWLILITFQSAIKMNEFQLWSFLGDFWAKYQGYSLTFWPQMAAIKLNDQHFWVIFGQNTKVIALLFGQKWLKLFNLQSK